MLIGCSGRSAPSPDHLTWSHIKILVLDENILKLLVWLANASFTTGVWPDYFKTSKTVVIPKPNKPAYNIPKVFRPVVLLNTLGKLFEKVIANRLQWECARFGLVHPCQFGGVQQNSTEDAGSYLTHHHRFLTHYHDVHSHSGQGSRRCRAHCSTSATPIVFLSLYQP